jgi:hypothetical protein
VITVRRTATNRQTSQAGKKEPTTLKEGARVQLVNNSIPSARLCRAIEVPRLAAINELNLPREVLKIVRNPFALGNDYRDSRDIPLLG